MAITQEICNSFKTELLTTGHDFTITTGNAFKIALFTSTATLSKATTVYAVTNEVVGTGYSAGGVALTNVTPVLSTDTAVVDFSNDPQWTTATFTAAGALIYNTSDGNSAVAVLSFGGDQTVSSGTFTIQFPTADASNAIIRIA